MNEMYEFGPFVADSVRRVLSRNGTLVSLSNKGFEVLMVLIRDRHRVVEKEELLNRVWPDAVVEDNNLTVAVSALRKALGEESSDRRYVVTVPGHGYRFAADVRVVVQPDRGRVVTLDCGRSGTTRPTLGDHRRGNRRAFGGGDSYILEARDDADTASPELFPDPRNGSPKAGDCERTTRLASDVA